MDHGQPYFTIFYATGGRSRDKLKLHETNEAIFRQKLNVFFIGRIPKKKKKKQIRGNLVISKGNGDTDDRRKREIN